MADRGQEGPVDPLHGFVELARAGQLVNNATFDSFRVFGLVALIYFAICFPLSRLSRHLEKVMNASRPH